jgi:acyl-coenzyme A thioesterase PaaI-like protein
VKDEVSATSPLLSMWCRLSKTAAGRWLFSALVCWKAPYFATIRPQFSLLEPGRCELGISRRRAVLNHIGTVHAIAMCNMAELAAGMATEVTIPGSHRWIPKGMTVEYLHKATTDLQATAIVESPSQWNAGAELPVPVQVVDARGTLVFQAIVRMWVTAKK